MEEENEKIEAEQENTSSLPAKKPPENKPPQKAKNNSTTWVILGVGLVIILTIIVLIGLKLQKSKNALVVNNVPVGNEMTTQVTDTPSQSSKILTKEELLKQAFYYPNTTKERSDGDYDLVFYTNDSVTAAYSYYEELASLNNWELGQRGMATDKSGGFLYIYQDDFDASVEVRKSSEGYGPTEIDIRIHSEEEVPLSSTLNRPSFESATESVETTPPPDAKTLQTSDHNEYVLPFSSSRKVVREDLLGLTEWQLKVARNEIYARHGRDFVHQDLSCYFDKLSWYKIDPEYGENRLSPLEISNAVLILNYEKEINSSLLDKDTGCK